MPLLIEQDSDTALLMNAIELRADCSGQALVVPQRMAEITGLEIGTVRRIIHEFASDGRLVINSRIGDTYLVTLVRSWA